MTDRAEPDPLHDGCGPICRGYHVTRAEPRVTPRCSNCTHPYHVGWCTARVNAPDGTDPCSCRATRDAATPRPGLVEALREIANRIPGSCDWGGCDNNALLARHDAKKGWLPVCQWHAGDASAADLAPITALPLRDMWESVEALASGTGEPE